MEEPSINRTDVTRALPRASPLRFTQGEVAKDYFPVVHFP